MFHCRVTLVMFRCRVACRYVSFRCRVALVSKINKKLTVKVKNLHAVTQSAVSIESLPKSLPSKILCFQAYCSTFLLTPIHLLIMLALL